MNKYLKVILQAVVAIGGYLLTQHILAEPYASELAVAIAYIAGKLQDKPK